MAKLTACDICGSIYNPSRKKFARTQIYNAETGNTWDVCEECQMKHVDLYLQGLQELYGEAKKVAPRK
jgi:hypothetical protein